MSSDVRNPLTITLCGSLARAGHDLRRVERALALAGHLVHAPCPPLPGERPATAEQIRHLTARHYAAMNRSDVVIAVVPDGIVGEATASEVRYAQHRGVRVLHCFDVDALVADVAAWLDGPVVAPYRPTGVIPARDVHLPAGVAS
ncbi:hypothetical protein ACGFIW_01165 [Micromonospora sp. NPDC048935]|uniref:hypothetical protein n=1 Tax=Micromonospora sp. NPDC048935 TaxID=3364262 RepID=UPI00371523CE